MTTEQRPIRGSIPALITPMLEDGQVDYPTLRKLIDWHVAEGTDGLVIVGTSGESPTVNVDEHREILRVSVEQAAKRIPIIAGCGDEVQVLAEAFEQPCQQLAARTAETQVDRLWRWLQGGDLLQAEDHPVTAGVQAGLAVLAKHIQGLQARAG